MSDLNTELVQTFRVVRERPRELARRLYKLPMGRRAFYRLRCQDPRHLSAINAAARFIYLNRFCFNGLFRTNLDGKFNVPYAPLKTGHLSTESDLEAASQALQRASVRSGDFEAGLADVRAGDFVYLDPPFAVDNRRVFKQYGPHTFGLEDLYRLSSSLRALDQRGAGFILSYAYCKEALEIFAQWPRKSVRVHRNVAGFAHCRRTATEVIISNLFAG